MTFYNALQLDPAILKHHIKTAETKQQKRWFVSALLVRDVLLVGFAILFVSVLSAIFGAENSNFAVVLFCMLLSIRFVHFGYQIKDSLLSLAVVFLILVLSPLAVQTVPPLAALAINLVSLSALVILTCEHPEMGNGGLYLFGYIFLTGAGVSDNGFWLRCGLALVGYCICGAVLCFRHKEKDTEVRLHHIFQKFDIHSPKSQWQLQLVLGVSILFFINGFFHLNKFMWAGFACSSLLSSYGVNPKERFRDRALGVILGSALFTGLYFITPQSLIFLYGPISGLCLGLCSHYRYKTIFNCFGALSAAAAIYGIQDAAVMRVFNNLFGLVFGLVFFWFFQKIMLQRLKKRIPPKPSTAESSF